MCRGPLLFAIGPPTACPVTLPASQPAFTFHVPMPASTDSNPWVALLTLTAMEIVLGVDNIVFIAILVARLPAGQRERIRRIGIALALVIRIGLLFALSW